MAIHCASRPQRRSRPAASAAAANRAGTARQKSLNPPKLVVAQSKRYRYHQPVFAVALGIAKVDTVGIATNVQEPVDRSIGALIVGKVTCRRYEYCLHVDIRTPAGVTATSDDIHRTNAERWRSSGLPAPSYGHLSQVRRR
jgi:hypothetical protein